MRKQRNTLQTTEQEKKKVNKIELSYLPDTDFKQ